jgi:hypothetical protein
VAQGMPVEYARLGGSRLNARDANPGEVVWAPPDPGTKSGVLTTDKQARKEMPIARGLFDYFPDACAYVAHVSYKANEQHNPGEPMHWAREKSTDHADCIARHLIERGGIDDDGLRHAGKLAWRALALLQLELEEAKNAK